MDLVLTNGNTLTLRNVLDCAKLLETLISVKQLIDDGFRVSITSKGATIYRSNKVLFTGIFQQGAYLVHGTARGVRALTLRKTFGSSAEHALEIHARMGHASLPYLKWFLTRTDPMLHWMCSW